MKIFITWFNTHLHIIYGETFINVNFHKAHFWSFLIFTNYWIYILIWLCLMHVVRRSFDVCVWHMSYVCAYVGWFDNCFNIISHKSIVIKYLFLRIKSIAHLVNRFSALLHHPPNLKIQLAHQTQVM